MMRLLCYLALTLLCSLPVSSAAQPLKCRETENPWPVNGPRFCRDKCRPGTCLENRNSTGHNFCVPCGPKKYKQRYNIDFSCDVCEICERPNMEYLSRCNATHNAVCKCKAGYECKDQHCKQCLPMPSTTTLIPTTLSTVPALRLRPTQSSPKDFMWYSIIVALLSAGIAIIVVTNIKTSILRWIRSGKYGYPLVKSHAPVPTCTADEEVSKPVQEAGNDTNLEMDPENGGERIPRAAPTSGTTRITCFETDAVCSEGARYP